MEEFKSTLITLLTTLMMVAAVFSKPSPKLDLEAIFDEETNSGQPQQQQGRVVGGAGVADKEYIPYQISMQYRTKRGGQKHFCGGSIISSSRILTAAHCVDGQDAKRISVVAGIRDLNDTSAGQRSQVVSYEKHENYQALATSDIAILSIEPPLQLDGERVRSIDVSGSEKVNGGEHVTLTGWGALWHFGQGPLARYPVRLQKLSYKTITNEDCQKTMKQLSDTEICALARAGKGACNGDSGGPLVLANGGELRQVGIVSYGTALCASNSPDVYTRVSEFDDWIKQRLL